MIPFLFIGLAVGVATWWMVRGRERGGWVPSILLGVLGSLASAFLGPMLGLYAVGQPLAKMLSGLCALALAVAYAFGTRPKVSREQS
jgi:uncharacterized membrane protein YeaQ/YmgE (transglycosylase-associated protein family)